MTSRPAFNGRVLIVEDDVIVAMDAEAILAGIGVRRIDVANNVSDALRIIETSPPDYALLDINLRNENSVPVALTLQQRGIPFVFTTGYGEDVELPPELRDVPRIKKPYMPAALIAALPLTPKV